tara:strand:- start:7652 stop:8596 length:945 start_codon:yes stop_codon:yes gene_type:complete
MRGLIYRTFSFVLIISIIFSYIYIYNVNPITFENDETNTNKSYCPDYWRYDVVDQSCKVYDASSNIGKFINDAEDTTIPPATLAEADQSIFKKSLCEQHMWSTNKNISWNGVSNIRNPCSKSDKQIQREEEKNKKTLHERITTEVQRNEGMRTYRIIYLIFTITLFCYLMVSDRLATSVQVLIIMRNFFLVNLPIETYNRWYESKVAAGESLGDENKLAVIVLLFVIVFAVLGMRNALLTVGPYILLAAVIIFLFVLGFHIIARPNLGGRQTLRLITRAKEALEDHTPMTIKRFLETVLSFISVAMLVDGFTSL